MRDTINIYTHNGLFHADDVFATALISMMCENINVKRGGDEEIPEDKENWIVFDIGGGELDHHTPECKEANGCHPGTNIPYAACGLVWRKYYKEILEAQDCPQQYVESVYTKVENTLILGIDASDNGFDPVADALNLVPNLQTETRKEIISASKIGYTVSALIKDFNPTWESDRDPYEAFMDAVSFAKDILYNRFDSIIDALDGREYILQNIEYSANHLMILDQFAPWQGVVTSQSRFNQKAADIWYVVSPALRGGWNVQCALDDPDNRTSYRHPLPESWLGLRAEEFAKASGVKDAKFCHPSGFLCGADSEEGALALAEIACHKKH